MIPYFAAFFGIVFIGETFFPSYTVYVEKDNGEIISYGVAKSSIEFDENGMVDLEKLTAR